MIGTSLCRNEARRTWGQWRDGRGSDSGGRAREETGRKGRKEYKLRIVRESAALEAVMNCRLKNSSQQRMFRWGAHGL